MMKKMRRHTIIICILMLLTVSWFMSGAELNSEQAITCMCKAPSSLPEEDPVVPLPSGFFSLYDAKHGTLYAPDNSTLPQDSQDAFLYKAQHESQGSLVMTLDQMRSVSPYVYATDGLVKITVNGTEQLLSMDKIDYVCDAQDKDLCYRLTCTPESGCDSSVDHVYMLCYSCTEGQSVLVGSVSYILQDGTMEASYPFLITGRNEFEAERHLEKKIALATVL